MSTPVVRSADPADIGTLCELYFEFHEFHVQAVPDRLLSLGPFATFDRSELSAAVQRILDDEDATILVAEDRGEYVGFAEVVLRQEEPNPMRVAHRYGHLQSLMVCDGRRGQRIGTLLVEAAEQWARDRGATEMRLDTWEFPGGPHPFYERIGYRTLRRQLLRQL